MKFFFRNECDRKHHLYEPEVCRKLPKEDNILTKLTSMGNDRRLENLAVWVHSYVMFLGGSISSLFLTYVVLFWPVGRLVVFAYFCFIYYEHEYVVQNGGRRWNWYRNSSYFKLLARYFNMKIVPLHELDPNRNYIFAGHPHGMWCIGTIVGTTFNCCGVDEAYPHHKLTLVTTKYNTCMPIHREYLVAGGQTYATEKSFVNTLTKSGPGRAVVVMVGGAREALVSDWESQKIRALGHKGFCRMALKCGSPIVPFYVFGETDTVKTVKSQGVRKKIVELTQNAIYKVTGGTYIVGDGDKYLLPQAVTLPRRCNITFVSGTPIEVKQIQNPTKEDVEELHKLYLEAIKHLYESEKDKYMRDPSQKLEFCY